MALLTLFLGGCGGTILPPAHVRNPVPVYVADYGRHSTILLPTPNGGLVEYAFGDWGWLAAFHRGFLNMFGALFFSQGSTLGRRYFRQTPEPGVSIDPAHIKHFVSFDADRDRVEALRQELDAAWESRGDTVVPTHDSDGFLYVRSDERYNLLHNCNHVTARWLRELGCEVKGPTITSKFKVQK
jgi:hypothetical protein